jgi:hypothetical protein
MPTKAATAEATQVTVSVPPLTNPEALATLIRDFAGRLNEGTVRMNREQIVTDYACALLAASARASGGEADPVVVTATL